MKWKFIKPPLKKFINTSISINLILHSILLETILGQIYSIYIITVAAVESAIGLSIMISFYKLKGSISIKFLNLLRG